MNVIELLQYLHDVFDGLQKKHKEENSKDHTKKSDPVIKDLETIKENITAAIKQLKPEEEIK